MCHTEKNFFFYIICFVQSLKAKLHSFLRLFSFTYWFFPFTLCPSCYSIFLNLIRKCAFTMPRFIQFVSFLHYEMPPNSPASFCIATLFRSIHHYIKPLLLFEWVNVRNKKKREFVFFLYFDAERKKRQIKGEWQWAITVASSRHQ